MPPKKRKVAKDDDLDWVPEKQSKSSKKKTNAAPGDQRHTRGMILEASRKAVLETTELLEMILLHLPNKDIYRVRRVCQKFKAVINDKKNKKFEAKLFIHLTEPTKVLQLKEIPLGQRTGYLVSKFHAAPGVRIFTTSHHSQYPLGQLQTSSQPMYVRPVRLNPLLKITTPVIWGDLIPPDNNASTRMGFGSPEYVRLVVPQLTFQALAQADDRLLNDAYVTDPPCQLVHVNLPWTMKKVTKKFAAHGILHREVQRNGGVTFGDIRQELLFDRGDCSHHIGERFVQPKNKSFAELHERMTAKGCKPAVFNTGVTALCRLYGVVVASEEEWQAVA